MPRDFTIPFEIEGVQYNCNIYQILGIEDVDTITNYYEDEHSVLRRAHQNKRKTGSTHWSPY